MNLFSGAKTIAFILKVIKNNNIGTSTSNQQNFKCIITIFIYTQVRHMYILNIVSLLDLYIDLYNIRR